MSPKGTGADTRRISDAEIALEVGAAAFRPISSQALSEAKGHLGDKKPCQVGNVSINVTGNSA
jgi:hypothetical protein